MKKNEGCEYCINDCKDKSQNAYKYCNRFNKRKGIKRKGSMKSEVDAIFPSFKGIV